MHRWQRVWGRPTGQQPGGRVASNAAAVLLLLLSAVRPTSSTVGPGHAPRAHTCGAVAPVHQRLAVAPGAHLRGVVPPLACRGAECGAPRQQSAGAAAEQQQEWKGFLSLPGARCAAFPSSLLPNSCPTGWHRPAPPHRAAPRHRTRGSARSAARPPPPPEPRGRRPPAAARAAARTECLRQGGWERGGGPAARAPWLHRRVLAAAEGRGGAGAPSLPAQRASPIMPCAAPR